MLHQSVIESLAIFNGKPAFSHTIHVGRPNVGNRERLLGRINEIVDSRWLSNDGPFVDQFEKRIAEILEVRHCIALCNATVALEIVIRALGLDGEVIVPSFTFVATAHALEWQGVFPVFCEVDPETHNIDAAQVEKLITPRTSGILGVHLWGRPCDIEALVAVANSHKLKLFFDASHAFGCVHRGRMIGNFGCAEVFSFHATKFVNSAEGGAVVTNDDDLAKRIRLMKNFGFAGFDNVISIGTNGKMSELSAAMGLTNLESIEEFIRINRANFQTYEDNLREIPGLSLLRYEEKNVPNYQYVVVEVEAARTGITRDQLVAVLRAENVLARRYFYPGVHRMQPYASRSPAANPALPQTEAIAERVIVLPNGTGVTPEEVTKICAILRLALAHGPEIAKALA